MVLATPQYVLGETVRVRLYDGRTAVGEVVDVTPQTASVRVGVERYVFSRDSQLLMKPTVVEGLSEEEQKRCRDTIEQQRAYTEAEHCWKAYAVDAPTWRLKAVAALLDGDDY